MTYTPGPKELAVKALREQRASRQKNPPRILEKIMDPEVHKAVFPELRAKVEEVKNRPPKPKKAKKKAARKAKVA